MVDCHIGQFFVINNRPQVIVLLTPRCLPKATAESRRWAYSGFLDAARMRDGLVYIPRIVSVLAIRFDRINKGRTVASCGLYLAMVPKSPLLSKVD